MNLRNGEDVHAAVDRVIEKLMKDKEAARHKAAHERVAQPNNYNEKEDDRYFRAYEDVDIHRQMIQVTVSPSFTRVWRSFCLSWVV